MLPSATWADTSRAAAVEKAFKTLKASRFVDLTHAFGPGIPHWKGFKDQENTTLYTIEKDGFFVERFSFVGQWGTHIDAPSHFHAGLRSVDAIRPDEMLLRLVVLDVHEQVARNPDYTITMEDVKRWEKRHGLIPKGSFVAMRTDWAKRWPSDAAMQNVDAQGVAHYPGWSKAVLEYLFEKRGITAAGHETTDTDPGLATSKDDYSLESYILKTNHFQIELMANLEQVPEAGALLMVTFPKPRGGSGFPARLIAIVP
ncbi:MAG: cyclase family protein [Pseudomonadota bacterium]